MNKETNVQNMHVSQHISNEMLAAVFYEYGGMISGRVTKSHICNDNGEVLCGVRSNWMEAGEPINKFGFIKGSEHLFPITDVRNNTCQKCLKKWLSANGRAQTT